jgi:hypothetical protein
MADRFKPNHSDVLERIERALGRVADALEQKHQLRWYEASWEDFHTRRRAARSVEAENATDARDLIVREEGFSCIPQSFHLVPLRNEQCKYCCAAEWRPDGVYCDQCGYSDEDGTRRRREGKHYDAGCY